MMSGMKPTGDRVLIEMEEAPEYDEEGGMGRMMMGRVLEVGPEHGEKEKETEKGELVAPSRSSVKCSKGDIVMVRCSEHNTFEDDGKHYAVVDPYSIEMIGSKSDDMMAGAMAEGRQAREEVSSGRSRGRKEEDEDEEEDSEEDEMDM
jgi:co-chaperonin GroES (HSP10)